MKCQKKHKYYYINLRCFKQLADLLKFFNINNILFLRYRPVSRSPHRFRQLWWFVPLRVYIWSVKFCIVVRLDLLREQNGCRFDVLRPHYKQWQWMPATVKVRQPSTKRTLNKTAWPWSNVFRQICKISHIAMFLAVSVSVCLSVCVSVKIVRLGDTFSKIKNVKNYLHFRGKKIIYFLNL